MRIHKTKRQRGSEGPRPLLLGIGLIENPRRQHAIIGQFDVNSRNTTFAMVFRSISDCWLPSPLIPRGASTEPPAVGCGDPPPLDGVLLDARWHLGDWQGREHRLQPNKTAVQAQSPAANSSDLRSYDRSCHSPDHVRRDSVGKQCIPHPIPRINPKRLYASNPYAEQEGVNLQEAGSHGETAA